MVALYAVAAANRQLMEPHPDTPTSSSPARLVKFDPRQNTLFLGKVRRFQSGGTNGKLDRSIERDGATRLRAACTPRQKSGHIRKDLKIPNYKCIISNTKCTVKQKSYDMWYPYLFIVWHIQRQNNVVFISFVFLSFCLLSFCLFVENTLTNICKYLFAIRTPTKLQGPDGDMCVFLDAYPRDISRSTPPPRN